MITFGELEALLAAKRARIRVKLRGNEPTRLDVFASLLAQGVEPCAAAAAANASDDPKVEA